MSSSSSSHHFYLPFNKVFRKRFMRKIWPIQLDYTRFTVCRIFLCSLTLCNTCSSLTRSVQLIFSILLQYHISRLPRYFRSTSGSDQISAPYRAYVTSFFFKRKPNLLVKSLFKCRIFMAIPDLILTLYREIIAVCSDSPTKHINALCGDNSGVLHVTADGTYNYHWNLNA
jgi:hypothetical protein